jgi:hypothetical protein
MSAVVGRCHFNFKYTSNQTAIGKLKDIMKADILALELFKDSISVMFQSQNRILRINLQEDAIEKGDESLVPLVAQLTDLKGRRFKKKEALIESTATRTECLTWWENNKNKWKIQDSEE